jgi:hypothetical protein
MTKPYQKPYHYGVWSMTKINPNSKPFNKKKTPYKRPKSREGKTKHSSNMTD